MLQYKEKKEDLLEYINENGHYFERIDEDAFGAMKALLGCGGIPDIPAVRTDEEGGINVCKALEDLYWGGVQEGIETGKAKGREEGREEGEERFRRLCLKLSESGGHVELQKILKDKEYCKEMYQKYGL